jgi:hypothetical protein
MKQTIGITLLLLISTLAWGQNPTTVLQSAKTNAQSVQQQKQQNGPVKAQSANVKVQAQKTSPSSAHKPVAVVNKSTVTANPKIVAVKSASNPVKPVAAAVAVKTATTTKPVTAKPAQAAIKPVAVHPVEKVKTVPVLAKVVPVTKEKTPEPAKPMAEAKVDVKDTNAKPEGSEKEKKETSALINITGKRDPFMSPVMSQSVTGSGCSVGKKCLAIDQVTVRGIVKSDNGMIAVVVNALDKAYFLRENDPVFNGYVEKITEDSIIFKETYQDKLGKPFTRDVTKRIPASSV